MSRQPIRVFRALSLVALLVCPVAASPAVSHRRKQAEGAYDRALDLKASFESQPEDSRSRQDCEKVARAFHEVYRLDPTYTKAPVSLQAIAQLYEEMGRTPRSDRYYRASVEAYRFLIAQYPFHPLSRDALLRIGEIYDTELRNPEAAQKAYQEFLEQYPRAKGSARARDRLIQLAKNERENEVPSSDRRPSEARRAGESRTLGRDRHEAASIPARESPNPAEDKAIEPAANAAPVAPREQRDHARNPPQLSTVRHWVGPNYSRVVITVDDEVKFETIRLTNPDRIVLDLMNTHLARGMNGKTLAAEDGYLRQIRVAQFKPDVTRVVLDVQKVEGYSVFALPNPFRLVIDIQGTKPELASKAPPEPSPETPGRVSSSKPPSPSAEASSEGSSRTTTSTTSSGEVALEPRTVGVATGKEAHEGESAAKSSSQHDAMPRSTLPVASKRRDNEVPVKPAAPMESGSRTLTRALGLKVAKIVIDPGHGGHDTGTVGPGGLCEKDLVLDVGLRVKKLIERDLGSTVIMTRNDDAFIPLEERTAVANQNAADLFISIHANASRDKGARGIETYYLNFTSNAEALEVAARENATSQESVHQLQDLIKKIALTEKIEESHEFANELQREVLTRLAKDGAKQKNRGVKRAPFVVLIGANMPSILTEISFLTNPRDERLLKRPEYRQKIAVALYQGLLKYMNTLGGVKVAQKTRLSEPRPEFPARQPSSSPDQPNF